MEGDRLSFFKWLGLALLFIGLPTVIAVVLSFSILTIYYII
ncbi:hypothetical protein J5U21_01093 [Saccharolobus shibatae]|uniref:Uncharacterized protein n=1 Tax=Saccharolobus shibatae TaxID=2286 RepID=A0A8F5BTY9_9CREN|nr:hypothetical protein J5U21_01093 [Saccharolobus shibatae]